MRMRWPTPEEVERLGYDVIKCFGLMAFVVFVGFFGSFIA